MYTRWQKTKQRHNILYVVHHYTQTNTNNANKTRVLLQIRHESSYKQLEVNKTRVLLQTTDILLIFSVVFATVEKIFRLMLVVVCTSNNHQYIVYRIFRGMWNLNVTCVSPRLDIYVYARICILFKSLVYATILGIHISIAMIENQLCK